MTRSNLGARAAALSRRRPAVEALVLCVLVGVGAAVGSALRAAVSVASLIVLGPVFPWDTLLVNILGSFAIGFYATRVEGQPDVGPWQCYLVMTGFCGGFTTFSMFSLETLRLAAAGDWTAATINLVLSIGGWLVAVWLGHRVAARVQPWRPSE